MKKSDTPAGWRPKETSFPARVYLIALVLAVAVPTILVTGYVLMRYADAERARLEEQLRNEARAVASALDRRFASMIEAVQMLAVTQDLDSQGLEVFHARAARARSILGRNLVLRGLDGQQLVNARLPWGERLPKNPRDDDKRAIESGQPHVTDVFESPVDGEKIISIVIPIIRDGKPIYLLNLAQELSYFENLLRELQAPDDHLRLIMDSSGIVVARNRDSNHFAGLHGIRTGPEREGAVIDLNLEGQRALIGWATSDISGWRTTASVRYEVIDAPRRQALAAIAGIGVSMMLVGFAFAWGMGARISRSLQSLTQASAALGAREPVPEVRTPLTEANEVGRALSEAERRLLENEGRLERALGAARMYSFEYNDRGTTVTRSASANLVLGDDDPNLRHGLRSQMRERIHPADLERFTRNVDARSPDEPEHSIEFRYIRPDGEIIWLHVNGVCEAAPGGGFNVTGFVRDVTARKEAEIRQALLMRELHHRVKNNLATVLALANLSGRNAASVQDYQTKLRARIQSMARSHSLLSESSLRNGFLHTLLSDELEPYAQGDTERIRLSGPDVDLPPDAALALGMAVHELATNAGKYGALSSEQGRLDVQWSILGEDAKTHCPRRLRLEWRESGGPAVTPPTRKGFGSRLLESVIGEQLRGRVELRYEPEGLVATIEALLNGSAARETVAELET